MIAHYVVTGVYSPVVKTLINDEISDSQVRATVLSTESAVKRLALLAVAPVLSLVFTITSENTGSIPSTVRMRPVLLICSGIALLALLTRYLYQRQKRSPSPRDHRGVPAGIMSPRIDGSPPSSPVPVGLEQHSG